jgi:hypothetical protein
MFSAFAMQVLFIYVRTADSDRKPLRGAIAFLSFCANRMIILQFFPAHAPLFITATVADHVKKS